MKRAAFYYRAAVVEAGTEGIYRIWANMITNCISDCTVNVETDVFFDANVSGLTDMTERKGFNQLLNQLDAEKYDVVITNNFCRLSRNMNIFMDMLSEIFSRGCEIRFVEEGVGFSNMEQFIRYMYLMR